MADKVALGAGSLIDLLEMREERARDELIFRFLTDGASLVSEKQGPEVQMTAGDLATRARAVAARLQDQTRPGDRVLLLYPSGLEFIVGLFGSFLAGVVPVPAMPPYGRIDRALPRLATIVEDVGADVGLTSGAILPLLESMWGSSGFDRPLRWMASDDGDLDAADSWTRPSTSRDDIAIIQYTSGSTSAPKGVVLRHATMLAHLDQVSSITPRETSGGVSVGWLPLYHDGGLLGGVLIPLHLGGQSVLLAPEAFLTRPLRWLEAITRFGATSSGGPSFGYDLCVRKVRPEQLQSLDLRSWIVAINGAEPVRWRTMQRFTETFAPCGFQESAWVPAYGMAEVTAFVSIGRRGPFRPAPPNVKRLRTDALAGGSVEAAPPRDERPTFLVGCGEPVEGVEVAIVDPETRLRCRDGVVGEIWVRGANVADGYWSRTLGAVDLRVGIEGEGGQYFRTGDLGFVADGEVFPAGRLKDLIIIGGRNIYPQDIEAALDEAHPLLRAGCGAAFSVEGHCSEHLIVVQEVVEAAGSYDDALDAIRRTVRQASGVQPAAVVLLRPGSVFKTSSGKIQRFACREAFLGGSVEAVAQWMSRGLRAEDVR